MEKNPQIHLVNLCLQESKQQGEQSRADMDVVKFSELIMNEYTRHFESSGVWKRANVWLGRVSSWVAEQGVSSRASCQQLSTPYDPSLNTLGQLLGHPGQLEGAW